MICPNCAKLEADKKRLLALVQSWVQKYEAMAKAFKALKESKK